MQILEYWDRAEKTDIDDNNTLFEDIRKMAGIPEWEMNMNQTSAFYHTHVLLAATIVHEFTHAFVMAYFARSSRDDPREPWAPGNRCNEQGYAFENSTLGGVLWPSKVGIPPMSFEFFDLQNALAPFGFYTTLQWDVWEFNTEGDYYSTMDSDRRDDDEPVKLVYPVPRA
jgi:hypothetical protein